MISLTENCERNAEFYRRCRDYHTNLEMIFKSENPHHLIRNLKFGRRLFQLFPELKPMNEIFQ